MRAAPDLYRDFRESLLRDENTLRLLKVFISLILGGSLVYLAMLAFTTSSAAMRAWGIGAALLSSLAALVLLRRGTIGAAVEVLIWGLWGALFLQVCITNGIMSRALLGLPVLIVLAGWLLRARSAIALCVASIGAGLALALAEMAGVLPLRSSPSPPLLAWVAYATFVFAAAAIAYHVFRGFRLRHEALRNLGIELSAQVTALAERKAELQLLMDNVPAMIFHGDRDLRCLYANRNYAEFHGLTQELVVGKQVREIVGANAYPVLKEQAARAFAGERPSFRVPRNSAHNEARVLDIDLVPELNENGEAKGFFAFLKDVTERVRAEDEVRQLNAELEDRVRSRTAELTAVNKELESFSYSISHDLRAPLRGIDGFSHILLEEYGDKLDAMGLEHLARVRQAAQRMGGMIDDILELSRVTRLEMRRERVDLSQIARETLDERLKAEPERNVGLTIAPDCVAVGDPQLLRILVENLLDNAWKYTRKTPDATIEFGCESTDAGRVFHIRDNGAGFDPKYADRLFQPFQRMHTAQQFEGTGVGLASVARVIRRHGGRVWAEAEVGRGAVFHFTLG